MKFEEAITNAAEGQLIRRRGWLRKAYSINPDIAICDIETKICPIDLIAEDWELVEAKDTVEETCANEAETLEFAVVHRGEHRYGAGSYVIQGFNSLELARIAERECGRQVSGRWSETVTFIVQTKGKPIDTNNF